LAELSSPHEYLPALNFASSRVHCTQGLGYFSDVSFENQERLSENCLVKALDGQAVGSSNQGPVGRPSTCNFEFKTTGGVRTSTINVETVQDAHAQLMSMAKGCKEPQEVLPAIGNEAYICTTEHGKGAVVERVIGRVRDQVFTILISSTGKRDFILSTQDLKSRISIASEQVSGNLF